MSKMVWTCGTCSANNNNLRTSCWRCDQEIWKQEIGESVTEAHSVSTTEKTRAAGTEKTRAAGTEKTRAAGTEKTRAADIEKTQAVGTEKTRAADIEKIRAAGTEKTRAADIEKTRSVGTKKTRAAGTETTRAADTVKTRAADTEKIRAAGTEKTRADDTEKTRAADTKKTGAAGTEKPRAGDIEQSLAAATEKTRIAGSEKRKRSVGTEKTRAAGTEKQTARIQQFIPGVDEKELRMVLIGKTGVGKSSTANTILGKTIFKAKASPKSVTEKCHFRRIERFGKKILLVDTPGLLDTSTPKNVIENEIKKCIGISAPGPHAFILVMSFTNRFTEEEQNVLSEVGDMFGDQMINYLVVLFTGRDQMDKGSTEHHIDEYPEEFRSLVQKAGGGYITFNNRGSLSEKEDDAQELLNRIDQMVKRNGGKQFTSEMFEAAEEVIQQRIANELAKKKEEIRKEIEEEIRKAVEEKMKEKYGAEITHLKGLREQDLLEYDVLKRELEQLMTKKKISRGNLKGSLRPLIIDEMRANSEKKLIHQIEICEGPEKAEAHRQLAGASQEIQQLLHHIRGKRPEAEVSQIDEFDENAICATKDSLVDLRNKERENIEREKGVLQKIKETLSGIMSFSDNKKY